MADGVRIRPKPDRVVPDNAMVVIRDNSRPFKQPATGPRLETFKSACGICQVPHFHKTYHLQLRAGSVIVSTTVWAKLQGMVDDGGMEYVNHVTEPPSQGLTINNGAVQEIVLLEKYVPPIL